MLVLGETERGILERLTVGRVFATSKRSNHSSILLVREKCQPHKTNRDVALKHLHISVLLHAGTLVPPYYP